MRILNLLKYTLPGSQLDDLRQDLPYQSPPLPWESIPANFNIITPQGGKSKNNPWDLYTDYFDIITKLNTESDIVICNDGSVDEQGRAGSGIYAVTKDTTTKVHTMSLRVNNGVRTLQTEVFAIYAALTCMKDLTWTTRTYRTVIHTDSMSAIQALQCTNPPDNVNLITRNQAHIIHYANRSGCLTINYVPSHIGIYGNEEADRLAKIGSRLEEQEYVITPSASQMKKSVRKVIKARAYTTYEGQQPGSDFITWHLLAAKGPPFKGTTTRNQQVAIHRLCLGYKCHWEIGVSKELDCPECNSSTSKPFRHYILEYCHSHQLFGPRMDVEVKDVLA